MKLVPNPRGVMQTLGGKYTLRTRLRDRDGDKVPDVFDCAPNNPRKQGWIHDVGKKIAGKLPEGKFKERATSYVEHREAVSEERKRVRRKEQLEYAGKLETIKGEAKLKRKKAYYEGGGFLGAVGRATTPRKGGPRRRARAPSFAGGTSMITGGNGMFGGSGIMGSAGGLFGAPSAGPKRKAKKRRKKGKGKQKQIVIKMQ